MTLKDFTHPSASWRTAQAGIFTSHSDQATKNFGKKIALEFKGGDVACLYGELGAGKTTLVKGIAEGLGVKETITSPTFTLMNVYQVQSSEFRVHSLVHIDTYRLKDEKELLGIGVEDYLGQPGTVTIVEWPEKIESLLGGKRVIRITLEHGEKDERTIVMSNIK